jgi:flagellar motor switch protein FliM
MVSAIGGASVDAIAVLGEHRSTVRELLALRSGDILRLESTPEEPLELRIGDQIVVRGMPVVHRGNLALQVSELVRQQPG